MKWPLYISICCETTLLLVELLDTPSKIKFSWWYSLKDVGILLQLRLHCLGSSDLFIKSSQCIHPKQGIFDYYCSDYVKHKIVLNKKTQLQLLLSLSYYITTVVLLHMLCASTFFLKPIPAIMNRVLLSLNCYSRFSASKVLSHSNISYKGDSNIILINTKVLQPCQVLKYLLLKVQVLQIILFKFKWCKL